MQRFDDAQIADFLRRSYFAVDGLWFVKAEECFGFEQAMVLDEAVWNVMSKIQARKARAILGITASTILDLAAAFELKLAAEGYEHDVQIQDDMVRFAIRSCPWYEILKSSGRTHIAQTIAERICKREFAGWAREFGPGVEVTFEDRLCIDNEPCKLCTVVFARQNVS
ncbi:MAG: DUF6125 family protein [Armatimonadota bacterium]